MSSFEKTYEKWIELNLANETNPRRREHLIKGLSHGTIKFLKSVWYPAVGNFDHLFPEWEVRDSFNKYRYLDLAYMPSGAKGAIEIQDYGSHARDLDVGRFKDLCKRHSQLSLDNWIFLFIAFPSIVDEPKQCQQLVLSFIGKFMSTDVSSSLTWLEAETVRFARRMYRPIMPVEVAEHLRVCDRHARRILHRLTDKQILSAASGSRRIRSYAISETLDA